MLVRVQPVRLCRLNFWNEDETFRERCFSVLMHTKRLQFPDQPWLLPMLPGLNGAPTGFIFIVRVGVKA